jgi:hypothetical protein
MLQDADMPNSPEPLGPSSTVCAWRDGCDDPAAVLIRSTDAPNGVRLCVPHAHDCAAAAVTLSASRTRGTFDRFDPRVTIEALPVDYDEPIAFALVDRRRPLHDVLVAHERKAAQA